MSRVSRYAFILAKVYGIIGRSYVGKNFRNLLKLRKVSELFDLLYPGARASESEHALAPELEVRIVRSGIQSMTYVLNTLDAPVEILVHLLRRLEYQNLKAVLRTMASGTREPVRVWDLGRHAGVALQGVGGDEKAIAASPYAWVLPLVSTTPIVRIETMLDRDYYSRLLRFARALPARDRTGVVRLVTREICLANVIWSLRLRFFFGIDAAAAAEMLIPGLVHAQRQAVDRIFEIAADSVEEWRAWRFGWLLEDQLGESFHAPDPVRAERRASWHLYERAHQHFHQAPFTLSPLVAFFALKQHEVSLLQTAVEALRLSLPEQEILAIVGAR
jgi:vacuolar-type H+-ATPase subunit C/Vma6